MTATMALWLIIIACGLYILNELLKLFQFFFGTRVKTHRPQRQQPAKPQYPRITAKQLKNDYLSGKLTRKGYVPPWERL